MPVKQSIKYGILLSVGIGVCAAVMAYGPIPQDLSYHAFADKRMIESVPNFWNVVSNIPFLIIGLAGMLFCLSQKQQCSSPLLFNNLVFFGGIALTGIGSSYYHYFPSNQTLLWDRLPMTISFMAFFSIIIGRYMCLRSAQNILVPLLLLGLLSVFYWQMTESKGHGDLRFYVLIQFLPIVLIPLILLLFHDPKKYAFYLWLIVLVYGLAKICEATDQVIFQKIAFSGHTIKHLLSALAPLFYIMVLRKEAVTL
ncbi:MAG: ceramidase domain-containing protein [Bacteroidota bacterium]